MKPMLAKRYQDQRNKVTYPVYVQPKINGVRALYQLGHFQSRDQKLWNPPVLEHIHFSLLDVPPRFILDGELYVHGRSLQQINGAISVNRVAPRQDTHSIQYHIFDLVDKESPDLTFHERHMAMVNHVLPALGSTCRMVPTYLCHDLSSAEAYFAEFKRLNYEGMMYRSIDAPYGLVENCGNKENRWHTLLKRKDWLDDEFICIDVEEGTGKYTGMVGSLVFQSHWSTSTFSAGSGLTDMQRRLFMDNPPIGRPVTIKYEMLSDTGVPLKPTIDHVHE